MNRPSDLEGQALATTARNERTPRLRLFHLVMAILVVALFGVLLRVYPTLSYDRIPGSWEVFFLYPRQYVLQYGSLPEREDVRVDDYTDGLFSVTLRDRTRNVYPSMQLLLMGWDIGDQAEKGRYLLPLGLVAFPASVLGLYIYLARRQGKRIEPIDVLLLYAYAVFPSWIAVKLSARAEFSVSAPTWTLFTLFVLTVMKGRTDSRYRFLALVFLIALTFMHATATLFLACLLLAGLVVALTPAQPARRFLGAEHGFRPAIFVAGIVIICSYYLYVGTDFFREAVLTGHQALSEMRFGWFTILGPYLLTGGTPEIQALRMAALVVSTAPLVFLVIAAVRHKDWTIGGMNVKALSISWMLGLAMFALIIFNWGGFIAVVHRCGEYASILSVLSAAMLLGLVATPRRLTTALRLTVLLAVVGSAALYWVPGGPSSRHLNPSEAATNNWMGNQVSSDAVIFTEFRIGTPLALKGLTRVTGILDTIDPRVTVHDLNTIFYSDDVGALHADLDRGRIARQDFDYLYFSERMTNSGLGIHAQTYAFRPPPDEFLHRFDSSEAINRIYDNSVGVVYRRHE